MCDGHASCIVFGLDQISVYFGLPVFFSGYYYSTEFDTYSKMINLYDDMREEAKKTKDWNVISSS